MGENEDGDTSASSSRRRYLGKERRRGLAAIAHALEAIGPRSLMRAAAERGGVEVAGRESSRATSTRWELPGEDGETGDPVGEAAIRAALEWLKQFTARWGGDARERAEAYRRQRAAENAKHRARRAAGGADRSDRVRKFARDQRTKRR